mmetsp:Transcript_55713/g.121927  ORF Transcript_55713/g.121927 Transcript_55713/m.121927 type:complete len:230 (+) Transcript_55713:295-984(+)
MSLTSCSHGNPVVRSSGGISPPSTAARSSTLSRSGPIRKNCLAPNPFAWSTFGNLSECGLWWAVTSFWWPSLPKSMTELLSWTWEEVCKRWYCMLPVWVSQRAGLVRAQTTRASLPRWVADSMRQRTISFAFVPSGILHGTFRQPFRSSWAASNVFAIHCSSSSTRMQSLRILSHSRSPPSNASNVATRFAAGLQAPSMHSQSVLWDNRQAVASTSMGPTVPSTTHQWP